MIYICMGVAGSGKTVVGQALAERLSLPFFDGDDFHPHANVQKMASGIALNDDDRWPWLEALAKHMVDWEQGGGAVLACSALKADYRRHLSCYVGEQAVRFIYLKGDYAMLLARLHARSGHFFPPSLLESALATLEEPPEALKIPADRPIDEIVERVVAATSAETG